MRESSDLFPSINVKLLYVMAAPTKINKQSSIFFSGRLYVYERLNWWISREIKSGVSAETCVMETYVVCYWRWCRLWSHNRGYAYPQIFWFDFIVVPYYVYVDRKTKRLHQLLMASISKRIKIMAEHCPWLQQWCKYLTQHAQNPIQLEPDYTTITT